MMTEIELETNKQQLTKWTADIVSEGAIHEYGEANRKLILNCYDLGGVVTLTRASYYYENWPSFDIGLVVNAQECCAGHRHSMLATSGGIYAAQCAGLRAFDFLSERANISIFREGRPMGCVSKADLAREFANTEKVEVWLSDPRIQYAAYATLVETEERIRPLVEHLPSRVDAMMYLHYCGLYRQRLNFSLDCFGEDPYPRLRKIRDDLMEYGVDAVPLAKEYGVV